MSSDQYYHHHPRTIIPVTLNPNDDQRFFRYRTFNAPTSNDMNDRMSARMREFEEECRRWRENFFNESRLESSGFPSTSLVQSRPRMRLDFPDFPEFGTLDWPTFRGSTPGFGSSSCGATNRSFIEEDNDGRKRYKVQFEIGEFRPEELNVRVEGRLLIVKGERQVKVGNATESKQFNRELTLPEFIDIKQLQSYLSDDGILFMEAPVILDRVYNNPGTSTITSSNSCHQSGSNRLADSSFTSGRPQPISNHSTYGNNQTSSFSSTSSTSSFRQDGPHIRETSSFNQVNPSRDHFTSTNSTSTVLGGHNQNPASSTYSTFTSRQNFPTADRNDSGKMITYKFDLHEFAHEDIHIEATDYAMKIKAVKRKRDGSGSSHREFQREIGLPEGADAKHLLNFFSEDGILTVQVPMLDNRPPLTTSYQSQDFNVPRNISTNDSYALGDQHLKLTFDLSGYKPEDVSVKVHDNILKVQASHVQNTADSQINREYTREYVLPDWVDVDHLRAKMSDNSALTIEAPIPRDRTQGLNRQIKIT